MLGEAVVWAEVLRPSGAPRPLQARGRRDDRVRGRRRALSGRAGGGRAGRSALENGGSASPMTTADRATQVWLEEEVGFDRLSPNGEGCGGAVRPSLFPLALPARPRTSITGRSGVKPAALRRLADAAGEAVVVDMLGLAAIVADQEDAVVQAIGMVVGDIGVGALDPAGEVGADEQVEDPVDAVGGDPAALVLRDLLGDVVGARPACRSSPARRTRRRASASIARPTAPSSPWRRRRGRRRDGCDGRGPWRNVGLREWTSASCRT